MEMLDGTEVVRAVDAPGAVLEAEDMVGAGADAGTKAKAGGGLVAEAAGGVDDDGDWGEWDTGEWVAGTGVDTARAETGALVEAGSGGTGAEVGAKLRQSEAAGCS